jgi:hypothetical protein
MSFFKWGAGEPSSGDPLSPLFLESIFKVHLDHLGPYLAGMWKTELEAHETYSEQFDPLTTRSASKLRVSFRSLTFSLLALCFLAVTIYLGFRE